MNKFFVMISEIIQSLVIGIKLVLGTVWQVFGIPTKRGLFKTWDNIWDNLVYLKPHHIFSFFYISFAILIAYLEFTPPASPPTSSTSVSSVVIMSQIFRIEKEWIIVMFGIMAWLVSNSRRPILYVLSTLPLFAYAYAVTYGVFHGLVITRGLLVSLAYVVVALFAITTIRQEIQNSINTMEIKKLKKKYEEKIG